jgi:WD40 repeat protein
MAVLLPCQALDETFRSLEYGFSIDYPKELSVYAYSIGSLIAIDDPVVDISILSIGDVVIGVLESNLRSVEDIALLAQSKYEDATNFTLLGSGDLEINGNRALFMDSIIEIEDGGALKIRDVFIENGDKVYQISCRAVDSKFKRANQTYFSKMIPSFRTFAINEGNEDNMPGFPVITGDGIWSSPALADVNGDGKKEAIFGTNEGNIRAIGLDGKDIAGFPVELNDVIRSSPALGDLNNDGDLEIVVGCDDGMLYAFSGNGSMLPGFPKETARSITSSPSIGDIDGDKKPEVVVGSRDGGIYAWHSDGSNVCGFPIISGGEVWSSPALGDMLGDGNLEITVGALFICKGLEECMYEYLLGGRGGKIYSLNYTGATVSGFPKYLSQTDNIGYSSPILFDLNQDGQMETVIAGTQDIYVKTSDENKDDYRGFPRKVDGSLQDSYIAMGDLDNDSMPEIAAGSTDGRLYVWRSDGTYMKGFPIQTGGYVRHVTFGDIDADGLQEILGGSSDNRVHAWRLNGTEVEGFPKVTLDDIETAPTLADMENDGTLELVVGSNDGQLYAWKISDNYGKLAWPMIRQNLQHTGVAKL